MNIKNGVKYSFIVILILIISISILYDTTLNNIHKNNSIKNHISNLVKIQETMNDITINTILINIKTSKLVRPIYLFC